MTIIESNIDQKVNTLRIKYDNKEILKNGTPIEEKLNVIAVISNPCSFKRRLVLMKEFIERMRNETHVNLYIVEMVYGDQEYMVTDKSNPNHLQLRTDVPLWHKENMINLGVKYLLPADFKSFAWIDADIEFENINWATDTLKLLNHYDIVQVFSHCLDMDKSEATMSVFSSFCYQYAKGAEYSAVRGVNYWHPGYGWACTRQTYEKMGGLFQHGILGSGDYNMAMSLIGLGNKSFAAKTNSVFKQEILDLQDRVVGLGIGYTPGVIRHFFHGSKKNRKYSERWQVLAKFDYNPDRDITTDSVGVIVPTDVCNIDFINEIYQYFVERNEDE